jgi:CRP/FNR family transcriptional regulator, cyclic AMP receptor protein
MEPGEPSNRAAKTGRPFNAQTFLESAGLAKTSVQYARGAKIFTQGDPCEHVMYIQSGAVKLSVLSETGREAVIAMLGPGDFFGEGCLPGQPVRMGSPTAAARSTILLIAKPQMVRLLHQQHAMSDRFIAHLLARTHPRRAGLGRSALQFQRKTPGARRSVASSSTTVPSTSTSRC